MRMSHAECKTKDISDFKHNIWYDLWILMQASLNHHMRRHQEKARRTEQFKESGEGCDDQRYSCVHEGDHEQQSVMKTLSEQSTLVQVDIVTSHGESGKWIQGGASGLPQGLIMSFQSALALGRNYSYRSHQNLVPDQMLHFESLLSSVLWYLSGSLGPDIILVSKAIMTCYEITKLK